MREGSLEPPVRHPIAWEDPDFYDVEKIDGKIGSNTRQIIGRYQRTNKLKVDCWPTAAVLDDMQRKAARN